MTQRASGTDGAARLGQELKLLVEEIVEHSAPWLDRMTADHDVFAEPTTSGSRCGWCPLCAAVELARRERPELTARAFEQSTQLIALLRAVLADRWHPAEGVHMPHFARDTDQPTTQAQDDRPVADDQPAASRRAATSRVQHVSVRRASPATPEGSV